MAASTPLIEPSVRDEEGEEVKRRGGEGWLMRVIDVEEAKWQIGFSFPMILTYLSSYGMVVLLPTMFSGHLGDVELAGAALANSCATVTGIALMTGLNGGLETLCGQAYGAKMYRMLGIYTQSSVIIATFVSVLVSFLWFFSESVLIWLHQNPEVAKVASVYLRFQIPGLFALAYRQSLSRFLQMQSVVIPLVVCSAIPLVIGVGITYLLVHTFGLGVIGASLGASMSSWISLLMLATYVKCSGRFRSTWQGFSVEAFRHVFPSLKLAIPSAMMVCLEYCAFEILVLLGGLMPNSKLSTSVIAMCLSAESISYMITFGFSAAVSTRVSNEVGAGNTKKAKNAVSVTLKLSFFLAVIVLVFLAFGHDIWARSFTDNPAVVQEFALMTPFLVASVLLDSVQNCLSGVARGCGWQHLAAWTNLITFYVIGLPLSLLFGFKLGLHNKGLWLGLICGLFCQAITLFVITVRVKWVKSDLVVKDEENSLLG